MIAQAFRAGNCKNNSEELVDRYLRDLPNSLAPSKVAETLQSRINDNLAFKAGEVSGVSAPAERKKASKVGLDFEWMADPYERAEDSKKQARLEEAKKQVSDIPFVPSIAIKKRIDVSAVSREVRRAWRGGRPQTAA